jgi:hypothetical protein
MIEFAPSFAYIDTTIAPGITISDYRRSRPPRRRLRLRHRGAQAEGQTLNVSMSMRFISSSALRPAGRPARPPGDHWGTNNRRIPGNPR